MRVAVVAATQERAAEIRNRLGMVRSGVAMAAGVAPLLGHRFTAIVVEGKGTGSVDPAWWVELKDRTTGPTFWIEETP